MFHVILLIQVFNILIFIHSLEALLPTLLAAFEIFNKKHLKSLIQNLNHILINNKTNYQKLIQKVQKVQLNKNLCKKARILRMFQMALINILSLDLKFYVQKSRKVLICMLMMNLKVNIQLRALITIMIILIIYLIRVTILNQLSIMNFL